MNNTKGCKGCAYEGYDEKAYPCVNCISNYAPNSSAVKSNMYTPKKVQENDMVNHPNHYNQGKIECYDALDDMVSHYPDPTDAALSWQVGKYLWRHPFKEDPLKDLNKCKNYLERLIKHLEETK